MMTRTAVSLLVPLALTVAASAGGTIPERLVQIRSVDLENNTIELRNFGSTTVDLDGWRFCTHSNAQARVYTASGSLNGFSIDPGASLFVHMDNDAAGAGSVNASDLGSFAAPFGQGPYGIQLYWPNGGSLSFGSNDDIVDHLQWSVMGVNNPVASTRAQQAVDEGLWSGANSWIATSGNTLSFVQIPDGGGLHAPADYVVNEFTPPCTDADLAEPFGVLDLGDIQAFVTGFTSQDPVADLADPIGVFDLGDIQAFVTSFTDGCP